MVKQPQFCDVTFSSNGFSFGELEQIRLQMMLGLWQSDGNPKALSELLQHLELGLSFHGETENRLPGASG